MRKERGFFARKSKWEILLGCKRKTSNEKSFSWLVSQVYILLYRCLRSNSDVYCPLFCSYGKAMGGGPSLIGKKGVGAKTNQSEIKRVAKALKGKVLDLGAKACYRAGKKDSYWKRSDVRVNRIESIEKKFHVRLSIEKWVSHQPPTSHEQKISSFVRPSIRRRRFARVCSRNFHAQSDDVACLIPSDCTMRSYWI